jgi:DNA-binding NtrC family response regulator
MGANVLFVDDEAAVLSGYARTLHHEFQVDTALGGELGLKALAQNGPYAVVISDMRMPGMSGAEFLAGARRAAPETVRMLLTGNADLMTAIEAVNEGNIFRFLTKPCPKDVLVAAIEAGVEQHRLIRMEKDLLEQTLMGRRIRRCSCARRGSRRPFAMWRANTGSRSRGGLRRRQHSPNWAVSRSTRR